jgi:hypothetical protein
MATEKWVPRERLEYLPGEVGVELHEGMERGHTAKRLTGSERSSQRVDGELLRLGPSEAGRTKRFGRGGGDVLVGVGERTGEGARPGEVRSPSRARIATGTESVPMRMSASTAAFRSPTF